MVLMVLLLVGSLLPAPANVLASPLPQQKVPRFVPGSCNYDVQTSLVEGRDLTCGQLVVPEQYANPSGPTIQLGVAIVKSHAANPSPDPLVMLQGGPGGSTIDTYLQFISVDRNLARLNRDIVLFDQRGTEFSKPSLFCQAYYDETIRQLNEHLSPQESDRRSQAALKTCYDQFTQAGINLSAYNSVENASDIESLRQALGYSQINLYGVSYGTDLALHYLKQYPQSLRSLTIDSVAPPQTNFIAQAPQIETSALNKLFTACAQDASCNQAYPNLQQVFYNEVDRLNKQQAHIQLTDPKTNKVYPTLLDGDSFLNAMIQALYVTQFIPLLPHAVFQVKSGDYSFLEQVLSLVTFDKSTNLGMYFSVLCAEDANFTMQNVDLSGMPPEMANYQKLMAQQFLETCNFWKVKPLYPAVDQPVSGSVPTLVLSGYFDPATPPAYAQLAAKTLPNSFFFEFPNGGHGEVTSGDCQDSVLLQFLQSPAQKPDGSCISQLKVDFVTPGNVVRVPQLINLLNLQGAAVPQLIAFGLALLILLTALLVYPLVWLVRLIRGPARPASPALYGPGTYVPAQGEVPPAQQYMPPPAAPSAARRPLLYRLAPWLAALTGLDLLVFFTAIALVSIQLAVANDMTVRVGLPGSTRALFILPLVAAVLALVMLAAAVTAWSRRSGSTGGRIYFSLLTVAAVVCVVVLGMWGMLTALVVG